MRLKDCADAVTVKVLELLLSPHRTTRALAVATLVQLGEPVAAFADDVARVMEHADAGCDWSLCPRAVRAKVKRCLCVCQMSPDERIYRKGDVTLRLGVMACFMLANLCSIS